MSHSIRRSPCTPSGPGEAATLATAAVLLAPTEVGRTPAVLLVQHHEHAADGYWSLPGRILSAGDDDETIAARACHAQTGIHPTNLRQVGCYRRPFADSAERVVTWAWGETHVTPDEPEPHSVRTARWVPVHTLLRASRMAYPAELDMIADALAVVFPRHGTAPVATA